jgi:glucosyl-3-phosphoglycerate synthase
MACGTTASARWDRCEPARRKGRQRISVVLPARNEAATVDAIVPSLRREPVDTVPLVDELVVTDSGSIHATGAVAADSGAAVVRQGDVLRQHGDIPGNREALCNSLSVTDGGIVVFIDAGLGRFDAQFAVGLVGPLVRDEGGRFAKAFYDRPLDAGATVLPGDGGRVTKRAARPLLNLHWPPLAGCVQPLSGESAARRSLPERVPFACGYGIEIAVIVEVVEAVGPDATPRVDLGRREHRNFGNTAVGRLAAQAQLAALFRLLRHDRALTSGEPSTLHTEFVREDGVFVPDTAEVGIIERPPLVEVDPRRRRVRDSA